MFCLIRAASDRLITTACYWVGTRSCLIATACYVIATATCQDSSSTACRSVCGRDLVRLPVVRLTIGTAQTEAATTSGSHGGGGGGLLLGDCLSPNFVRVHQLGHVETLDVGRCLRLDVSNALAKEGDLAVLCEVRQLLELGLGEVNVQLLEHGVVLRCWHGHNAVVGLDHLAI